MNQKGSSFPEDLRAFAAAVLHEWTALLTGSALIAALAIFERWRNQNVPWGTYALLVLGMFISACYRAWSKEHREVMRLKKAETEAEQRERWHREEMKEQTRASEAAAREERIAAVVRRWRELGNEGGGIGQLQLAGGFTLKSDEELREACDRLFQSGFKHPFGGYAPFFEGMDALEALRDWPLQQRKKGADLAGFLNRKREALRLPPAKQRNE